MRIYASNEPGRPDRTAGGRWELAHNQTHDGLDGAIRRQTDSERPEAASLPEGVTKKVDITTQINLHVFLSR